jgi:hypothetical protein
MAEELKKFGSINLDIYNTVQTEIIILKTLYSLIKDQSLTTEQTLHLEKENQAQETLDKKLIELEKYITEQKTINPADFNQKCTTISQLIQTQILKLSEITFEEKTALLIHKKINSNLKFLQNQRKQKKEACENESRIILNKIFHEFKENPLRAQFNLIAEIEPNSAALAATNLIKRCITTNQDEHLPPILQFLYEAESPKEIAENLLKNLDADNLFKVFTEGCKLETHAFLRGNTIAAQLFRLPFSTNQVLELIKKRLDLFTSNQYMINNFETKFHEFIHLFFKNDFEIIFDTMLASFAKIALKHLDQSTDPNTDTSIEKQKLDNLNIMISISLFSITPIITQLIECSIEKEKWPSNFTPEKIHDFAVKFSHAFSHIHEADKLRQYFSSMQKMINPNNQNPVFPNPLTSISETVTALFYKKLTNENPENKEEKKSLAKETQAKSPELENNIFGACLLLAFKQKFLKILEKPFIPENKSSIFTADQKKLTDFLSELDLEIKELNNLILRHQNNKTEISSPVEKRKFSLVKKSPNSHWELSDTEKQKDASFLIESKYQSFDSAMKKRNDQIEKLTQLRKNLIKTFKTIWATTIHTYLDSKKQEEATTGYNRRRSKSFSYADLSDALASKTNPVKTKTANDTKPEKITENKKTTSSPKLDTMEKPRSRGRSSSNLLTKFNIKTPAKKATNATAASATNHEFKDKKPGK